MLFADLGNPKSSGQHAPAIYCHFACHFDWERSRRHVLAQCDQGGRDWVFVALACLLACLLACISAATQFAHQASRTATHDSARINLLTSWLRSGESGVPIMAGCRNMMADGNVLWMLQQWASRWLLRDACQVTFSWSDWLNAKSWPLQSQGS